MSQSEYNSLLACRDNLAFMRGLPDASAHLVMTSPPYNVGKEYETRQPLWHYLQQQDRVISECVRLLKPEGSICWQVGNFVDRGAKYPLDLELYPIFRSYGLKLRNRIIWHYGHGTHATKRLSDRHEAILWFTRDGPYTFNLDAIRVPQKYPDKKHFKGPKIGQLSCNPLGKNPGDVWDIPNVKHNHVEKTEHPCQYPIELAERLVLMLTRPGDIVFDPYVGSGSTVIAALRHDRIGYGCDIEQRYITIASERVRQLETGTLRVRAAVMA
jgi:adenine-specific DNA-methyltransferase